MKGRLHCYQAHSTFEIVFKSVLIVHFFLLLISISSDVLKSPFTGWWSLAIMTRVALLFVHMLVQVCVCVCVMYVLRHLF